MNNTTISEQFHVFFNYFCSLLVNVIILQIILNGSHISLFLWLLRNYNNIPRNSFSNDNLTLNNIYS